MMERRVLPNGQIRVWLDQEDATTAGTVAVAYGLITLRDPSWNPDRDFRGNFWDLYRDGLIAEYAVALGLGLPWDPSPPGTYDDMDIGGFYQVKSTPHENGCLMLDWPKVKVDGVYVLATGRMPLYTLRGWVWGDQAKQVKYLRKPRADRPEQLFVPQSELHAMDAVPRPGRSYSHENEGTEGTYPRGRTSPS